MAGLADDAITARGIPTERSDRLLGYAAIVMLAIVLAAIARGHAHWREPPVAVWGHLGLLIPTLVLTPVMMIRPKGSRSHRWLGYVWVALMTVIAIESFFIPLHGRSFSPIWPISIFVLVQVPRLVLNARRHNIDMHRRTARGLVIGAFLVAGFFTLPFGRMLGVWLFKG
jgi:uncharacterized membrane protein